METFYEQKRNPLVHCVPMCTNGCSAFFLFLISLNFADSVTVIEPNTPKRFGAHMKWYKIVKSNGIIKCKADQMCIAHAHKLRVDTLINCFAFGIRFDSVLKLTNVSYFCARVIKILFSGWVYQSDFLLPSLVSRPPTSRWILSFRFCRTFNSHKRTRTHNTVSCYIIIIITL